MTFPMKNSVLDNFPPCPPAQAPLKNAKFYFYCRLAFSEILNLTFFHADFGKEFPSRTLWRDPSRNCPSPSSALCPLLYRTKHFSRAKKWLKCAEKRGERAKGAKRKKGRVKTVGADFWEVDLDSNFSIFGVRRFTEWPRPLH